jgi:riboflavin synthase
MFTGIIQNVAEITRAERTPNSSEDSLKIAIKNDFPKNVGAVQLGESIAVNGVCLTVTEVSSELDFFVGYETLKRSNLKNLKVGSRINLERALLASDRLSGHVVQGHVDGEAKFLKAEFRSGCWDARLQLPSSLTKYCVDKGSISLNGVSLTIASIDATGAIGIMLIPHTWEHTNLSTLKPGDLVNVEVDVLAKYMEKLCQPYFKQLTT